MTVLVVTNSDFERVVSTNLNISNWATTKSLKTCLRVTLNTQWSRSKTLDISWADGWRTDSGMQLSISWRLEVKFRLVETIKYAYPWITFFLVLAHWILASWVLSNKFYRLYELYLYKFVFKCLLTKLY